jgi:hypothetical protein
MSGKLVTAANTVILTQDFTSTTQSRWYRFYIYPTAWSASATVATFALATSGRGSIRINNTRSLSVRDASGVNLATSTSLLPLNEWSRVEFSIIPTVSVTARLYPGNANVDSAGAPAAGDEITGYPGVGTSISRFTLGIQNASTSTAWLSGVKASATTWVGPEGGGATPLVIDSATHGQTAGAVALTQAHVLAIASATQDQTAGSLTLTQNHVLTVASATHGQTAGNVVLATTTTGSLVIQSATHGQTAGTVTLTQKHTLVVAGATHGQTAGAVLLIQHHVLTVAGAGHGQSAQNVTLTAAAALVIQSASHGQTAEAVSLTQAHLLVVASATHGQLAGTVALLQAHLLDVASGLHGQTAESLTLTYHPPHFAPTPGFRVAPVLEEVRSRAPAQEPRRETVEAGARTAVTGAAVRTAVVPSRT